MRHLAMRIAPIVLAVLCSLLVTAPALANVDLAYFDVIPGAGPTEAIVRWGTETETDTAGFLVKRGVNSDPVQAIPVHTEQAQGSSISGYDYLYNDTGLTPGQIYYYWLIALTTDGQQVALGVRQITAGGTPLTPPRSFMPLVAISATSSVNDRH